MPNRAVISARTLGEEIEHVLGRKLEGTKISGTIAWIARQINAPARVVREEIQSLVLQGKVRSRTHRGGQVLYRLKDRHDDTWDRLRLPVISLN